MGNQQRGRLISPPNRQKTVELIGEAVESWAREAPACEIALISVRTYQRWKGSKEALIDKRATCQRQAPGNKLTKEERQCVFETVNRREFKDLPPSKIVPILADEGVYLASESTLYRMLRAAGKQHHRGRAKEPEKRKATTHKATAANQVYTWDITYLNSEILLLVLNIGYLRKKYSRI